MCALFKVSVYILMGVVLSKVKPEGILGSNNQFSCLQPGPTTSLYYGRAADANDLKEEMSSLEINLQIMLMH